MKWWLPAAVSIIAVSAAAEPYLAARAGLKCASCHINTSGGGMRTAYGNAYAQSTLAAEHVEAGSGAWNELFRNVLRFGGDLRSTAQYTEVPNQEDSSTFDTDELRLYAAAHLIPERLLLYVDQQVAPGGSINREAYVHLSSASGLFHLKAGKMYLPFGLRLEDDSAFIRQVSGINFTTPDKGMELGLETDHFSGQLAVSNGTAGSRDTDSGKQFSLRVSHVWSLWRFGMSANLNDTELGDRKMAAAFVTLRTGAIVWLGEYDVVEDKTFSAGPRDMEVGLLEGNVLLAKGHNLKLTVEYFEPDTEVDEDEQNRYSAVYEYTPFQFLQFRIGARVYDGIPQNDLQNRKRYFLELHGFF